MFGWPSTYRLLLVATCRFAWRLVWKEGCTKKVWSGKLQGGISGKIFCSFECRFKKIKLKNNGKLSSFNGNRISASSLIQIRYLGKSELNNSIRCINGSWYLNYNIFTPKQYLSRRHFWKFFDLLWYLFNLAGYQLFSVPVSGWISGKSNPVSGRTSDNRNAGSSSRL
jgi:hypothetical protein